MVRKYYTVKDGKAKISFMNLNDSVKELDDLEVSNCSEEKHYLDISSHFFPFDFFPNLNSLRKLINVMILVTFT